MDSLETVSPIEPITDDAQVLTKTFSLRNVLFGVILTGFLLVGAFFALVYYTQKIPTGGITGTLDNGETEDSGLDSVNTRECEGQAYQNIDLNYVTDGSAVSLPVCVHGGIDLWGLRSAKGLRLPVHVGGSLGLGNLTSLEGLTLPSAFIGQLNLESIEVVDSYEIRTAYIGDVNLSRLEKVNHLVLPEHIGYGGLDLSSLEDTRGIVFPKRIDGGDLFGGNLLLGKVTKADDTVLPEQVPQTLDLSSLVEARNLVLPKRVGNLLLPKLVSTAGVTFPEEFQSLDMRSVSELNNLTFPSETEDLSLSSVVVADTVTFPEQVVGDISLGSLMEAKNVTFPKRVYGDVHLDALTTTENVVLPEYISGDLYINNLTDPHRVVLPVFVGGLVHTPNNQQLSFRDVTKIPGLRSQIPTDICFGKDFSNINLDNLRAGSEALLPDCVHNGLTLMGLTSPVGLVLPSKHIGGDLHLDNLQTTDGLVLPSEHLGGLYLNSITHISNLEMPREYVGHVVLNKLANADRLIFPKKVGSGGIELISLLSTKGIVFPEDVDSCNNYYVCRAVRLDAVTNADDTVLPKNITAKIGLTSLKSAKNLVLPERSTEDIYLWSLTTISGITFPSEMHSLHLENVTDIHGWKVPQAKSMYLLSVTNADHTRFPEEMKGSLYLPGLVRATDLILPTRVEGDVLLTKLESASGVTLPKYIGGDLYLYSLKDTKGLVLPEHVGGNIVFVFEEEDIREWNDSFNIYTDASAGVRGEPGQAAPHKDYQDFFIGYPEVKYTAEQSLVQSLQKVYGVQEIKDKLICAKETGMDGANIIPCMQFKSDGTPPESVFSDDEYRR